MYHRANRSLAFTLLEVMVATVIIGLLGVTLHRFVATNLRAIRMVTEKRNDQEALEAVVDLVRWQLRNLAQSDFDELQGKASRFHGLSNDELTWLSNGGPGLMTTAAVGRYRVTLTVQPVDARSSETELGLRREPLEPEGKNAAILNRGGGDHRYNWLSLIRPMAAIEIRYFDLANHAWVENWPDPSRRPELVRIRLWRRADGPPLEAILPVPAARLQP